MDETGLLFLWQQGTSVDGKYCIQKIQRTMNEQLRSGDKKRLTLKDLSGAFVVLGAGYAIGIVTFIMESYNGRILKNRKVIGNANGSQHSNKPTMKKPSAKNKVISPSPGKVIQLEIPKPEELAGTKP